MFRRCCCNRYYCSRSMDKFDITIDQLEQMRRQGALIIDIRSPQEYEEGHINGAIVVPEYEIYRNASRIVPDKKQIIIVYCETGIRSRNALKMFRRMGYINVYNLYKGTENY